MKKVSLLVLAVIVVLTVIVPLSVAFARYIPCDYCGDPIVYLGSSECGHRKEYGCRRHVPETSYIVGSCPTSCPLWGGK